MADSIVNLRRRIGSASDLQSVVRAMKAQAAASIGQYTQSVASVDEYARTVELALSACFRNVPHASAGTRTAAHATAPACRVVVFGSGQGLVGRFNDTLAEFARATLSSRPEALVWAVGERMRASLADTGIFAANTFAVPATVEAITDLVAELLVATLDAVPAAGALDAADELHLLYHRPAAGSGHAPVAQRLLPLDAAWREELVRQPWPTQLPPETLGDPVETLRGLVREHVFISIFRASAASLASENASRLAAMDRADRNIDQRLQDMNDRFRRLRQSKIDDELADVVSGFKAIDR